VRDFPNSDFLEEIRLRQTPAKTTPPSLLNARIAAAMSHPTRLQAMTVLFERTASPKEIAEEMGEPVNNVTYHVKRLLDLGCIQLVDVRPAGGGRVVEHFYRATTQVLFEDEAWEQFGEKEKTNVTAGIMRLMSDDITEAMIQGTFSDPDDNHLSRSPMAVDGEGWKEVESLLKETLEQLMTIQTKVVERRASGTGDGKTLHTRVHMIHFRSPGPTRGKRV
jgi:DNA-binding transcriptional ArsR family regulator